MTRTLALLALAGCSADYGTFDDSKDPSDGTDLPSLEVDRIVPDIGPVDGGTSTTITGAGFSGDMTVTVGSQPCAALTVVSSAEIACTTPAGAAGEYAVTVTREADGAEASVGFTYELGDDGGGTGDDGGTGGEDGGGEDGGGEDGGGEDGGGEDDGGDGTGGDGTGGGEEGGGESGGGTGGTPIPVDYCQLQYPCTQSLGSGAASDSVYVWVYQAGVTEGAGQGGGITVQVGVGADGSDPSAGGWTWTAAAYNEDKDGLSPLANDEYEGGFTAPSAAGDYDYCGRVSADGGVSWTYCDYGGDACAGSGSDDGYASSEAGQLTVAR